MIKPDKLYLKRKDIPIQSLLDMAADESPETTAKLYDPTIKGGREDPSRRSTTLKLDIVPEDYPEVTKHLLNMVNVWDPTLDPNDFRVKEFNYLRYGKGDKFVAHQDKVGKAKVLEGARIFSTSTIVRVSEDLTGGVFRIWDKGNTHHHVELDPGETIFFSSLAWHEILEVTKGNREVLVAWISYK